MQRLAEIAQRRLALQSELSLLDAEEREIRRAMEAASALDPTVVAIVQESGTQHGCAQAQAFLDQHSGDVSIRNDIFNAMLPELRPLLSSTYGALFVQKVLDGASPTQLGMFIRALGVGNALVEVAATPAGSRALQRVMECLPEQQLADDFVGAICNEIIPMSNDVNACHIVQRALTTRFNGDKDRLINALIANLWPIATSKQGCCVLQRAIDWTSDAQRTRLIDAILVKEIDLVQDAFGNYVVQHLLDRNDDALSKKAIQALLHNVAALSCNKFGSNVVEKCVRIAQPAVRQLLIDELTDPSVLARLLQDSFANYVIQTAISSSNDEQFQQLHNAIRPNAAALKNSPYGVRVESKIQRRLKDNARAKQRKAKKEQGAGPDTQPVMMQPQQGPLHQPALKVAAGPSAAMQPLVGRQQSHSAGYRPQMPYVTTHGGMPMGSPYYQQPQQYMHPQ